MPKYHVTITRYLSEVREIETDETHHEVIIDKVLEDPSQFKLVETYIEDDNDFDYAGFEAVD